MKKRIVTILFVLGLISISIGVTYSFFNYTKNGSLNNILAGTVNFSSSQDTNINLSNIFPMTREEALSDNSNNIITINIDGNTTSSKGIEYLLSITDSNIEINNKKIPISLIVTGNNLGDSDINYFTNRGESTSIYKTMFESVEENNQVLVGFIKGNTAGINGSVTIKAFVDADKIAISDTYDGTESDEMGTTNEWVNGRTVFTTSEWSSLKNNNSLSFKIKVEANEGIWVEEQQTINVMNTFPNVITDEKEKITQINFQRMNNDIMNQKYDSATIKADITYNNEGKVLAWLEENTLNQPE